MLALGRSSGSSKNPLLCSSLRMLSINWPTAAEVSKAAQQEHYTHVRQCFSFGGMYNQHVVQWSSNRAAHFLHGGRRSEQDNMLLQLREVPSGAGSFSCNIYQGIKSRL